MLTAPLSRRGQRDSGNRVQLIWPKQARSYRRSGRGGGCMTGTVGSAGGDVERLRVRAGWKGWWMVAREALETVCIRSNSRLTQWPSGLSITSSMSDRVSCDTPGSSSPPLTPQPPPSDMNRKTLSRCTLNARCTPAVWYDSRVKCPQMHTLYIDSIHSYMSAYGAQPLATLQDIGRLLVSTWPEWSP